MKKILAFFIFISIALTLSCSQVVEPADSIDPHGIFFSVDGNIYKIDYEGSNEIQLTFDEEDNNNPWLSNDGKYLIYETQTNINRYPSGGLMYDYSVINIMDLNNGYIRTIADENEWCSQPSLSPDNQLIVFYTYNPDDGGCIVLSDIEAKEMKKITEYGRDRNPMITPQGNKIIYLSDRDQKTNIFIMDLDGNNKQQLTDTEWNIHPAFSPDGSKILWESYRDIFMMDLDGSNMVNLTNNNNDFARTPAYSHSGDQIVFITERTYNVPIEESIREIHIMDLRTNERKTVLKTGANFEPMFFPEDNKIVLSQYENSQFYICVINIDGSGFNRFGRGGNPCVY